MSINKLDNRIKIPFSIHPFDKLYVEHCGRDDQRELLKSDGNIHTVEKSDSEGRKRRYLKGITSGMKTDGHGERMTKKCIAMMQEQANSGEILLYEGQHGVTHTEDVGRLVESKITPMGDWITLYRIYDQYDDVGPNKLERADTLWKQVNGLPPYKKPLQKGFSIEGFIPDGGIVEMSENGQRTIDAVELDGVLVTPRPAYETAIASAIYKALDELPPDQKLRTSENIRGKLMGKIHNDKLKQNYYSKRFKLEDALNEAIDEIIRGGVQVRDRLDLLFQEYSQMMIDLILEYKAQFIEEVEPQDRPDLPDGSGAVDVAKGRRVQVLNGIIGQLERYAVLKTKRIQKQNKERQNVRHGTKCFKPRGKKRIRKNS